MIIYRINNNTNIFDYKYRKSKNVIAEYLIIKYIIKILNYTCKN